MNNLIATFGGLILLIAFGALVSIFYALFSRAGRKRPHFRDSLF